MIRLAQDIPEGAVEALETFGTLSPVMVLLLIGVLGALILLAAVIFRGRGEVQRDKAEAGALATVSSLLVRQQANDDANRQMITVQTEALRSALDELKNNSVATSALRDILSAHTDKLIVVSEDITKTRASAEETAEITRQIRAEKLALERAVFPYIRALEDVRIQASERLDNCAATDPAEVVKAVRAMEVTAQTQTTLLIERLTEMVRESSIPPTPVVAPIKGTISLAAYSLPSEQSS